MTASSANDRSPHDIQYACVRALVVSIGSELTSGKNLDTNSQWLSVELAKIGIPVQFHTTVGDDLNDNVAALRWAAERCELVVITGGLGPTQDDLTREAMAVVAGVGLESHEPSFAAIQMMFARRKRAMPERNRVQAMFPAGSEPIPNLHGTAPGIWMRVARRVDRGSRIEDRSSAIEDRGSKFEEATAGEPPAAVLKLQSSIVDSQTSLFIAMPGVPSEMYLMFDEQVRPRLVREFGLRRVIVHRKINLFGAGESDVESRLLDLTARGREPEVGITVHDATISLRIAVATDSEAEGQRLIEPTARAIYDRLGPLIFSEGEVELQQVVADQIAARGLTISTAEGCTGGTVAERLVSIPGASRWFRGGVVAYSDDAKHALLGVPSELVEMHGAASREVAEAMAVACRIRFSSDLAVSTVGVAGPDGATDSKPLGTLCVAVAAADRVKSNRVTVWGDRATIQSRAAKHALNQVRLWLESPAS